MSVECTTEKSCRDRFCSKNPQRIDRERRCARICTTDFKMVPRKCSKLAERLLSAAVSPLLGRKNRRKEILQYHSHWKTAMAVLSQAWRRAFGSPRFLYDFVRRFRQTTSACGTWSCSRRWWPRGDCPGCRRRRQRSLRGSRDPLREASRAWWGCPRLRRADGRRRWRPCGKRADPCRWCRCREPRRWL